MLRSHRTVPSAPTCVLAYSHSECLCGFPGKGAGYDHIFLHPKLGCSQSQPQCCQVWSWMSHGQDLKVWNMVISNSLKLFPVARQSHRGDTSANHLVQLHCSEPCHSDFEHLQRQRLHSFPGWSLQVLMPLIGKEVLGCFLCFGLFFALYINCFLTSVSQCTQDGLCWRLHIFSPSCTRLALLLEVKQGAAFLIWTIGVCPKNNGLYRSG